MGISKGRDPNGSYESKKENSHESTTTDRVGISHGASPVLYKRLEQWSEIRTTAASQAGERLGQAPEGLELWRELRSSRRQTGQRLGIQSRRPPRDPVRQAR